MEECNYFYTAGDASTSPQIASSTCAISTSTPPLIATSTDIVILPTMTAGEVLIAFFLFVIVLLHLFSLVIGGLERIKTKKKYLAYGGGDVEIREDI